MKFNSTISVMMLALLANAVSVSSSMACSKDGKEGIAPRNNLNIPAHGRGRFREANGVSEDAFNAVIAKVKGFYAPIIAAKGATFNVVANWTDGTVNAYADRDGNTWNVHMFGGLARHKFMTADGFALVMCHEIGHHLGGQPRIQDAGGDDWASDEGEADYFGNLKCLRRVFDKDDNETIVSKLNVPAIVKSRCAANHTTKADVMVCARTAMAGQDLAYTLASLKAGTPKPDFTTPDKSIVTKTFDDHPEAQCRMDTYFAAAACHVPFTADMDTSQVGNPTVGTCSQEKGDKDGYRPRCWYAPAKSLAEFRAQHRPRPGGYSHRGY